MGRFAGFFLIVGWNDGMTSEFSYRGNSTRVADDLGGSDFE
jgi:hypothetical protein